MNGKQKGFIEPLPPTPLAKGAPKTEEDNNEELESLLADNAPDSLLDPITQCLYREPVLLSTSGRTISLAVLKSCNMNDPFTKAPCSSYLNNRDKAAEV